jgi:hypothetical protein
MWVFETGKMNGTGYLLLATGNISFTIVYKDYW